MGGEFLLLCALGVSCLQDLWKSWFVGRTWQCCTGQQRLRRPQKRTRPKCSLAKPVLKLSGFQSGVRGPPVVLPSKKGNHFLTLHPHTDGVYDYFAHGYFTCCVIKLRNITILSDGVSPGENLVRMGSVVYLESCCGPGHGKSWRTTAA